MPVFSPTASLLRRYRALADRYLGIVAHEQGMHPTDTSALSHLLDQERQDHVVTAGELATLINLSGPATTAAIDRLERRGLVERRPSAGDGRRVEVHLSKDFAREPGTSIFADMGAAVERTMQRHSADEVRVFEAILTELCDEIERINAARS